MSRATPYLSKPTTEWNELFEKLSNSTFFLLSRNGPTVFRVKDEEEKIFKVTLGSPHSCTCLTSQSSQSSHASTSSGSENITVASNDLSANSTTSSNTSSTSSSTTSTKNIHQFCVHKLYCILKVLRISKDHPLSYQSSYTDSELDQVLSGKCSTISRTREREAAQRREQVQAIRAARQQRNNPGNTSGKALELAKESTNFVPRQPLQEPLENEDINDINICPICQDTMTNEQPLSWCRRGCGNNVHATCMQHYSNHKTNNNQETTCPLCRESWDLVLLKLDATSNTSTTTSAVTSSLKNATLLKVKCSNCSCYPKRLFYRCIECSQKKYNNFVDYCNDCYPRIGEFHSDHHFITSDVSITNSNEIIWLPCRNPRSNLSQISSSSYLGRSSGVSEDLSNNLNILLSLQSREITTNDYNLLLMLDENNARNNSQNPYQVSSTDLISHLLLSLPIITTYEINKNPLKYGSCWCCSSDISTSTSPSPHSATSLDSYYLLPCTHIVHKDCLKSELDLFQYEDFNKLLLNYSCHHTNCSKKIFYCLKRIKNKKKVVKQTEDQPIPSNLLNSNNTLLPLTSGMRISALNNSSSNSLQNSRNNSTDFIGIVGDTLLPPSSNSSQAISNRNFLPSVTGSSAFNNKKNQIINKKFITKNNKEFRASVSSPSTLTSLDGILSSSSIQSQGSQSQIQVNSNLPSQVISNSNTQSSTNFLQGEFQAQLQSQYLSLIQSQEREHIGSSIEGTELIDPNDVSQLPPSNSSGILNNKKKSQKLLPLGKLRSSNQLPSFSSSSNSLMVVSNQANSTTSSNNTQTLTSNSTSSTPVPTNSSFFKLPTSSNVKEKGSVDLSSLNAPVLEILDARGNNLIQTNKKERSNHPPLTNSRTFQNRFKNTKLFKEKDGDSTLETTGPLALSIHSYNS